MRVIAGTAKGRRLKSPGGLDFRPSGDRLKEALFSSVGPRLPAARVLDLYAGTGALGIEALSRGAARAVFVESNPRAAAIIRDNLELTGLAERADVAESSVQDFVRLHQQQCFTLILMDPPYDLGMPADVLESMPGAGAIDGATLIVLEASKRKLPFEAPPSFVIDQQKIYGDSVLIYLSLAPARARA